MLLLKQKKTRHSSIFQKIRFSSLFLCEQKLASIACSILDLFSFMFICSKMPFHWCFYVGIYVKINLICDLKISYGILIGYYIEWLNGSLTNSRSLFFPLSLHVYLATIQITISVRVDYAHIYQKSINKLHHRTMKLDE